MVSGWWSGAIEVGDKVMDQTGFKLCCCKKWEVVVKEVRALVAR